MNIFKNHINSAPRYSRFSMGKSDAIANLQKDFAQPLAGGKEHENEKEIRRRIT